MSDELATERQTEGYGVPPSRPARTRIGRWWLDLPLRTKGLLLTVVPLTVTVGVLLFSVALERREADGRNDVRVGTEALVEVSLLTESIDEAESAVRGFAATGDETMLGPLDATADRLPGTVAALADDAGDRRDELREIGEAAEAAVEALVAARDTLAVSPDDAATNAELLAPADAAVDDFLQRSMTTRTRLLADVAEGANETVRLQDLTQRVLVIGLVAAIATSLAGGAFLATGIIGRTVELSDNVARFWRRRPLRPALSAADEIGELARTLGLVGRKLIEHERELTASRDQALAATRAKNEFLSRTSHELRTPLSAIIGFGQLLQMEDLSEDDRESVDHIVRAGQHLLALINEVLDIARIEGGHLSLSVEPVVLGDVIDESVALVRPQADQRSVTVTVDLGPGGDQLMVMADRQRLQQVLLNLLTNAVKFNRQGGHVEVVTTPVGAQPGGRDTPGVRVAVADTGPGIGAEGLMRLFEPFERLDAGDHGIEGAGIGLALSKSLVEAMGGVVGVESQIGEGSTFWFELDLAEPEVVDEAAAGGDGVEAATARGTTGPVTGEPGPLVLYIEDNLANVRLVERVLRHRRERLAVTGRGREGLAVARGRRPALILLDLDLPDLSGVEVLRRLQDDPTTRAIPVVVVSADATDHARTVVAREGATDYVTKPIDVPRFHELLDELLGDGRAGPAAAEAGPAAGGDDELRADAEPARPPVRMRSRASG